MQFCDRRVAASDKDFQMTWIMNIQFYIAHQCSAIHRKTQCLKITTNVSYLTQHTRMNHLCEYSNTASLLFREHVFSLSDSSSVFLACSMSEHEYFSISKFSHLILLTSVHFSDNPLVMARCTNMRKLSSFMSTFWLIINLFSLVLITIISVSIVVLLIYVTVKLTYAHISEKRLPKMDPEKAEVRRDSLLIADLEEFHLRSLHQLIMRPILSMNKGVPIESNINFISVNGGLRESNISIINPDKNGIKTSQVLPIKSSNPIEVGNHQDYKIFVTPPTPYGIRRNSYKE